MAGKNVDPLGTHCNQGSRLANEERQKKYGSRYLQEFLRPTYQTSHCDKD